MGVRGGRLPWALISDPCSLLFLDFYLDIHTRRKVQAHEHINRLRVRIKDINQTVMCADFKVLV